MSKGIPFYLRIEPRINSAARLAHLRALVANKEAGDWRKARAYHFGNWRESFCDLSQGSNTSADGRTSRPVWYCHTGEQFRNERFADDVERAGIDHTGWFSDDDQRGKFRGLVADLPHGKHLAGYYWTENGERVYFDRVFDDAADAARYGDSEAERIAEEEREYNRRWQEARALSEKIEKLESDISELFPMRHHARARRELAAACEFLRDKRERMKSDYSDISL